MGNEEPAMGSSTTFDTSSGSICMVSPQLLHEFQQFRRTHPSRRPPLAVRQINQPVVGSPGECLEQGKRLSETNVFGKAIALVNRCEAELRAREQQPGWGQRPRSTMATY